MSPEIKQLFYEAKEKLRETHKFIWFSDGKILVRRADKQKVYQIKNETDIQQMMLNPQPQQ